MLNCKECIKNDVCGIRHDVNKYIENLKVDYNFQQLEQMGVNIDMACKYCSTGIQSRILKGVEE